MAVLAGWTRALVAYVERRGLPRVQLLEGSGLDDDALADPDNRIHPMHDALVWEAAVRELKDPDLGIHFAESLPPGSLGLMGYLARSSSTYGAALGRVVRYYRLLDDRGGASLEIAKSTATLSFDSPRRKRWHRQLSESALTTYVVLGRRETGQHFVPRGISFQHPQPDSVAEHARVFGCPLSFDQPTNALIFSRETLDLPIRPADPLLGAYLENIAASRLNALPAPGFQGEVRTAAEHALRSGDVSLKAIARELRVSPRTLQRKLTEVGLSFQDVLDDVRYARALELMARGDLSLAEVTSMLGFADPSAFRRAFKRWTGGAPGDLKRREPST